MAVLISGQVVPLMAGVESVQMAEVEVVVPSNGLVDFRRDQAAARCLRLDRLLDIV